jgi:hypothetical protein
VIWNCRPVLPGLRIHDGYQQPRHARGRQGLEIGGLHRRQAEAVTRAVKKTKDLDLSSLATKTDVAALRVATKSDLAALILAVLKAFPAAHP